MLWKEIEAQGFIGSFSTVRLFIAPLRKDSGKAGSFKSVSEAKAIYATITTEKHKPLTPLQIDLNFTNLSATPISAVELRQEIMKKMKDWVQEIFADPEAVNNRWYQPYIVLSFC